jgi:hypothetical protein
MNGLNRKLVENWLEAADDLGIRATAPVELRDADGQPFWCEVFVHDFASPNGGVVASRTTERRVRQQIRSLGDGIWVCVTGGSALYRRKFIVDELLDWGWFGAAGEEPAWYAERMPR